MSQTAHKSSFDHQKWSKGRDYYHYGITHSNHLKDGYARRAVHYYLWCGDREYGIDPMPGEQNAARRHSFYMAVLDAWGKKMELPIFWRSAEEKGSWAAAHWVPDAKHRQQRINRERHQKSVSRIDTAYNAYKEKHGKAPSRNTLATIARCGKDAASAFLSEKNTLGPSKRGPAPAKPMDPASNICSDLKVLSFRTNIQEKSKNMSSGPSASEAANQVSNGPGVKRPLPAMPFAVKPYWFAVHTNRSCHLEKQKCPLCAKESACQA